MFEYQPSLILTALEKEILELAIEDYTRLADVFAQIRPRLPGRSQDEYVALSKAIVRKLLQLELVRMYFEDWAAHTETRRAIRELGREEIEQAFLDLSHWIPELRPTPDDAYLAIGATDKGEQAMYER